MIKCVIFDLDGVIVDSEEFHFLAWKEFLRMHGKKIDKDEQKHLFGITNFEIFKILIPEADPGRYLELDEEKESLYRDFAAGHLKALPGAVELIMSLKKEGIKLAIGSSGNPVNIRFNLEKLGVLDYFDAIVSSHDVKKGKPNPEVFLIATKKLGTLPKHCVVIEDSYHGIVAARSAGMKVIGVMTTHEAAKLKDADMIVKTLKDLNVQKILHI
ncbi:MAG: HAD family phosphatase [archaeon]